MNPLVGLQTGWTPPSNTVSWQQGMPGLMGNVLQPPSQQAGLMGGGSLPSLQGVQPGDWSSVAYNMAGRPTQGPSPTAPGLPMPPGVSANGSSSSGGGSSIGGTALGILGALAKNPALLKSAGNGISSLWNSLTGASAIPASVAAEGNSAAAAANAATGAYAANGTAGISELPSVASAVDAAPGAADAAGSGAAAGGGLLGAGAAGSGAVGAAGANALAASGGFATGGAAGAAGGSSAAAGGSLGALGTTAAIAAPFIFQKLGLMIGDAWTGKNTQGSAAMKDWMQSSGVTFKPNYTNSGQNTFGTNNGLMNASSNPGTFYDKSGNVIAPNQAANAIYQWALANHVNPGDFHP